MPNFNYCSLVWNLSSAQSLNKIENLQKRALRLLVKDYDSTYEDLLEKFGYPNMNLRRERTLCIEIYKTLNKLNPGYMNDIFKLRNIDRLTREKNSTILYHTLHYHIKTSDDLNSFKAIIKCWDGDHCTCRVCEHPASRQ